MNLPQILVLTALVAILLLAGIFWWLARRNRATAGLPSGQVVYDDSGAQERVPSLYAPRYALAGKPDYVLRQGQQIIPVEVKPGRRAATPYEADVLQLAAYCLLVEESLGSRPPYGLLRYQSRTFCIPYDLALQEKLLATLAAMRRDLWQSDVSRSHNDPQRCHFCGHRGRCGQSLAPRDSPDL